MKDPHDRREFLHRLAVLGGAVALGTGAPARCASPAVPLPKRILGRTGVNIPALGLGLGPLGIADFPPEDLQAVVEAAIEDWGVRSWLMSNGTMERPKRTWLPSLRSVALTSSSS